MYLSPSMMCADFSQLQKEVSALDEAGADVFHLDIMDGDFVPNFALSWHDVTTIRKLTDKLIDVHLMVSRPDLHLPFVLSSGVDIAYFHFEVGDITPLLKEVKRAGIQAGMAINPETSVDMVSDLLPLVDRVMVMRVKPGFAGQKPDLSVDAKIEQLLSHRGNFKIALDGAVSPEVISTWSKRGVDEFVLGTSSIFGKGRSYIDLMSELRRDHEAYYDQKQIAAAE